MFYMQQYPVSGNSGNALCRSTSTYALVVQGTQSGSLSSAYYAEFAHSKQVTFPLCLVLPLSCRFARCINGLLKLIEQERCGETVNRSLIKSLIRMLIDLHVSFAAPSSGSVHRTSLVVNTSCRTSLSRSCIEKISSRRFYELRNNSTTTKVVS